MAHYLLSSPAPAPAAHERALAYLGDGLIAVVARLDDVARDAALEHLQLELAPFAPESIAAVATVAAVLLALCVALVARVLAPLAPLLPRLLAQELPLAAAQGRMHRMVERQPAAHARDAAAAARAPAQARAQRAVGLWMGGCGSSAHNCQGSGGACMRRPAKAHAGVHARARFTSFPSASRGGNGKK